ncbi:MAG: hypothetical protein ACR2K6_00605 [Solirubrobacterales bacterium]
MSMTRWPGGWAAAVSSAALIVSLAAVLAAPTSALAEATSSIELERTARAALAGDPVALTRLRGIDEVDGRPTRIGDALAGAEGSELDARLERIVEIAAAGVGESGDAAASRADADRIIGELPPPEGDQRDSPDRLGELDQGGTLDLGPLGLVAAVIALAGGGLLAYRLSRGRERTYAERAAEESHEADATPDELVGRAERAEREGDYAAALRLRLRWALGVLGRRGAVEGRSSLTPAAAARQLADPRAEELVATFERVVYGREVAVAADAEAAREGWPRVIETASGR